MLCKLKKGVISMLQKFQRFGAAMFVPVLLFPFAGIMVGLTTLLKNQDIMNALAHPDSFWYKFWTVIEAGGWAVFKQMPLLFAVGLPIGLAKKAQARAVLASLISYLTFNYFINAILTIWGPQFGVDFEQEAGGVSGLTEIAGIKTLDTNIIGAILISAIVVYLHNRYFDKKLPDFWGFFKGPPMSSSSVFLSCCLWHSSHPGVGRSFKKASLPCKGSLLRQGPWASGYIHFLSGF